jgi:hypothetical protein
MTSRNDYNTTIIHGKKPVKRGEIVDAERKTQTTSMNSASLERKIDSGDMGLHPYIDKDVSHLIQSTRISQKNGEKTLTQRDLATLANQRGGKSITPKDIADIESGNIRLTTENKLKIQAVKKALSIK